MNNYRKIANIYNQITLYSKKKKNLINLNNLINYGNFTSKNNKNFVLSSQYLHNELPIRLSQRIKDLDYLPYNIYGNNYISNIREWYIKSFFEIRDVNFPNTFEESEKLVPVLDNIYKRHSSTLVTMANAIKELKHTQKINNDEVQIFLDKFYLSRISIRILLKHYLDSYQFMNNKTNNMIGIVNTKCCPHTILKDVIHDIKIICDNNYIDPPEIIVNDNKVDFPFISSHLYYVLFELLKNSVKAQYDFKSNKDINVNIMNDNNWIVIKISDNGGGIMKNKMSKIWNYSYSSTNTKDLDIYSDFGTNTPISGFGYGLPISKLYMNYFGGNIEIFSKYGVGTDTYIFLRTNGNFNEPLI